MNERYAKKSLAVLQNLFPNQDVGNFAVRLWNGALWQSAPGCSASFTLVLRHPGALRAMLWPPNELSIGEAYIYDDIDVEGDIAAFFAFLKNLRTVKRSISERLGMAIRLMSLPSSRRRRTGRQAAKLTGTKHSKERDQQAVRYHYDVSNDFFALWLDSQMVYSCAYFTSPEDDLDTAQKQKVDYICRKLRLQPGERLLDIGCGWGGLVIHACKH